jgi:hypothetical protein
MASKVTRYGQDGVTPFSELDAANVRRRRSQEYNRLARHGPKTISCGGPDDPEALRTGRTTSVLSPTFKESLAAQILRDKGLNRKDALNFISRH